MFSLAENTRIKLFDCADPDPVLGSSRVSKIRLLRWTKNLALYVEYVTFGFGLTRMSPGLLIFHRQIAHENVAYEDEYLL